MIWELNDHMGTKCVPQSHDGLTLPWNMTKANKYLEPRSGARVSASWTVRGADPIWDATKGKSLITKTKRSIVDWDTQLIVGVKTNIYTYHYAVAYGYRSRLHQTCTPVGCQTWWTEWQIYLNLGWGAAKNERRGDRGWISDHIWFVGELTPGNRADTFPSSPTAPTCSRPVLKKGSSGTHVKFAQQKLLTKGNPYTYGTPVYFIRTSGGADGRTYNAVVAFQKMAFPNQPGEWDGIIGSKTWAKLGCN